MKNIGLLLLFTTSLSAWALPRIEELQAEYKLVNWSKSTTSSVIINAPISEVWAYVSDSTRTSDWSVFFDHISPLPGIEDGQVGSIRRCYRTSDLSGPRWDELTILINPKRERVITTYNLRGFKYSKFVKNEYVFVKQTYRASGKNESILTFQTYFSAKGDAKTRIAYQLSQNKTKTTFDMNLQNIKAAIEGKARIYDWH